MLFFDREHSLRGPYRGFILTRSLCMCSIFFSVCCCGEAAWEQNLETLDFERGLHLVKKKVIRFLFAVFFLTRRTLEDSFCVLF